MYQCKFSELARDVTLLEAYLTRLQNRILSFVTPQSHHQLIKHNSISQSAKLSPDDQTTLFVEKGHHHATAYQHWEPHVWSSRCDPRSTWLYGTSAYRRDVRICAFVSSAYPLFGLPETYALNSFYLKRHPYGKTGRRQQEQGQHLLDDLVTLFTTSLTQAGWTYTGVSPNNGTTPIWQPPQI